MTFWVPASSHIKHSLTQDEMKSVGVNILGRFHQGPARRILTHCSWGDGSREISNSFIWIDDDETGAS